MMATMYPRVIEHPCGFPQKSWVLIASLTNQVLGGYGYCEEYQVERLWRDSKLLEIGGGTLEAHHKNMVSS